MDQRGAANPQSTGALNIYLAVLSSEEKLLDIPDETERAVAFHKLLDQHTFIRDPLPRERLVALREEADGVVEGTEKEGVSTFLRIEEELAKVLPAIQEFAHDLDWYFEQELDLRRGK